MNTRAFPIPKGRGAAIFFAALMAATAIEAAATTPAAGTGDTVAANPFGAKSAAAPATSAASVPGNPFGPKSESAASGTGTGAVKGAATDNGVAALRAMLLQRFDKNGDGKLDADELTAARAVLSGGTDRRALTPQQIAVGGSGPLFGLRALLQRFDRNGDGVFDAAELAEIHGMLFADATKGPDRLRQDIIATFDKNGDGRLDAAELAAAQKFWDQTMADLGKDGGGKNSAAATGTPRSRPASPAASASGSGSGEPAMK